MNDPEMERLDRDNKADLARPPTSLNPFAANGRAIATNAAAETDQARAVAEVQAAMVIAQRFPRNEVEAMDKILNAFTRPTLAEVAQYEYAKGGSEVRGPSIRSAEAIAQLWGHIHSGVRELDRRPGVSTVETFAFDAQTGSHDSKTFQVEHLRYTRKGSYRLEDPREVYELIANQAARRKRACLLAVIPGDVVEAAMRQADVTLKTKAEITPERLTALVARFAELGVTKDAIEKRIQRRIDTMSPAQMVNLGKIYNSLTDGMSAPADWFEIDAPATADATSKSGAAGLKQAATAATSSNGGAKQEAQASGETIKAQLAVDYKGPDADEIKRKFEGAKDGDDYSEALSCLSSWMKAHQGHERIADLTAAADVARKRITE